jgi:hypothetical protein
MLFKHLRAFHSTLSACFRTETLRISNNTWVGTSFGLSFDDSTSFTQEPSLPSNLSPISFRLLPSHDRMIFRSASWGPCPGWEEGSWTWRRGVAQPGPLFVPSSPGSCVISIAPPYHYSPLFSLSPPPFFSPAANAFMSWVTSRHIAPLSEAFPYHVCRLRLTEGRILSLLLLRSPSIR